MNYLPSYKSTIFRGVTIFNKQFTSFYFGSQFFHFCRSSISIYSEMMEHPRTTKCFDIVIVFIITILCRFISFSHVNEFNSSLNAIDICKIIIENTINLCANRVITLWIIKIITDKLFNSNFCCLLSILIIRQCHSIFIRRFL